MATGIHRLARHQPRVREASADRWVLAIDYPFDDPGFTAADDEAKIRDLRPKLSDGNTTIVWLPDHFSDSAAQELGNLVIINHLLSGTRLEGYTQNLNSQERTPRLLQPGLYGLSNAEVARLLDREQSNIALQLRNARKKGGAS